MLHVDASVVKTPELFRPATANNQIVSQSLNPQRIDLLLKILPGLPVGTLVLIRPVSAVNLPVAPPAVLDALSALLAPELFLAPARRAVGLCKKNFIAF